MEGTERQPWCTHSPGVIRAHLSFSPAAFLTNRDGMATGRATELCLLKSGSLEWPAWKAEVWASDHTASVCREHSESRTTHFPPDGGTLDFTHRLLYSPLPFIWQHSTAFPAFSPASCFSLWDPGWPWKPLLRGKVRMTWCTPQAGLRLCCMSGSGWALARSGGQEAGPDNALVPGKSCWTCFPISKSQWPVSPTPFIEATVFPLHYVLLLILCFKKST